jgi:hypothetical protein
MHAFCRPGAGRRMRVSKAPVRSRTPGRQTSAADIPRARTVPARRPPNLRRPKLAGAPWSVRQPRSSNATTATTRARSVHSGPYFLAGRRSSPRPTARANYPTVTYMPAGGPILASRPGSNLASVEGEAHWMARGRLSRHPRRHARCQAVAAGHLVANAILETSRAARCVIPTRADGSDTRTRLQRTA